MSAFTLSAARQTLRVAPSSARRASAHRRATTVRAMAKQIIATDKAPSALGPYNQAVKVRDDDDDDDDDERECVFERTPVLTVVTRFRSRRLGWKHGVRVWTNRSHD